MCSVVCLRIADMLILHYQLLPSRFQLQVIQILLNDDDNNKNKIHDRKNMLSFSSFAKYLLGLYFIFSLFLYINRLEKMGIQETEMLVRFIFRGNRIGCVN